MKNTISTLTLAGVTMLAGPVGCGDSANNLPTGVSNQTADRPNTPSTPANDIDTSTLDGCARAIAEGLNATMAEVDSRLDNNQFCAAAMEGDKVTITSVCEGAEEVTSDTLSVDGDTCQAEARDAFTEAADFVDLANRCVTSKFSYEVCAEVYDVAGNKNNVCKTYDGVSCN